MDIAKHYGVKEGDGPIMFSEADKLITRKPNEMLSYIKGRFLVEATKG
jgi:hypothetical protein